MGVMRTSMTLRSGDFSPLENGFLGILGVEARRCEDSYLPDNVVAPLPC